MRKTVTACLTTVNRCSKCSVSDWDRLTLTLFSSATGLLDYEKNWIEGSMVWTKLLAFCSICNKIFSFTAVLKIARQPVFELPGRGEGKRDIFTYSLSPLMSPMHHFGRAPWVMSVIWPLQWMVMCLEWICLLQWFAMRWMSSPAIAGLPAPTPSSLSSYLAPTETRKNFCFCSRTTSRNLLETRYICLLTWCILISVTNAFVENVEQ